MEREDKAESMRKWRETQKEKKRKYRKAFYEKIRPELQNSMARKRRERLINKHHVQHKSGVSEWELMRESQARKE